MTANRSKATAATVLVVAAVVAASSAWALASQASSDASPAASSAASEPSPDTPRPGPRDTSTGPNRTPDQVPPKRLEIRAIGVDAPVVPTGVTKNGDAEIPPDGDVVGWYEYGSAPGASKGSVVLIGHRDTNAEGPGALFDLDLMSVGDDIAVTAGRRSLDYRVTDVRSVPKAGLPSSLFRRGGPPQLVVITCGGAYIPEAGGYQENLFVVAVPAQ